MKKMVRFNNNIEYINENNNSYYSLLLSEGDNICKFVSDNNNSEIETDEDNIEQKCEINNIDVIDKVYNIFMTKYKHLDNDKNKNIIYNLCSIAVTKMPQYRYNPKFYLNFIESSIQNIKKNNI
jgi:hypothetical protein